MPLAALGGGLFFSIALNADECNWCDRGPNGEDTLNGLDRSMRTHLLWPAGGRHAAAYTSDAMAGTMAVLPHLRLKPTGHHAAAMQTMAWVFAAPCI